MWTITEQNIDYFYYAAQSRNSFLTDIFFFLERNNLIRSNQKVVSWSFPLNFYIHLLLFKCSPTCIDFWWKDSKDWTNCGRLQSDSCKRKFASGKWLSTLNGVYDESINDLLCTKKKFGKPTLHSLSSQSPFPAPNHPERFFSNRKDKKRYMKCSMMYFHSSTTALP